jgi:hypothetical protein
MRPLGFAWWFALLVALAAAPAASTAPVPTPMSLAVFDDAQTLEHPATTFAQLQKLHVDVARITLDWSRIAPRKPAATGDPGDPAYRWKAYDTAVQEAQRHNVAVLFTIWGTPAWANGNHPPRFAPLRMQSLWNFAYAAASRYGGAYTRAGGATLPRVKLWLAWDAPNSPAHLMPQGAAEPADAYARICSSIYAAVHAAQETAKVGCGASAPAGDRSRETTKVIAPGRFLRAVRAAGLTRFDAWAEQAQETFAAPQLAAVVSRVTSVYGPRRVWITRYGVRGTPAEQARLLRRAYAAAKAHPRVDLFTWDRLGSGAALRQLPR